MVHRRLRVVCGNRHGLHGRGYLRILELYKDVCSIFLSFMFVSWNSWNFLNYQFNSLVSSFKSNFLIIFFFHFEQNFFEFFKRKLEISSFSRSFPKINFFYLKIFLILNKILFLQKTF